MPKKEKRLLSILAVISLVVVSVGLGWIYTQGKHSKAGTASVRISIAKKQTVSDKCAGNSSGKAVVVSISKQYMWACQVGKIVKESVVTTGATAVPNGADDATPTGVWHIYEKFRNLYLQGHDVNGSWKDYVQYWMPFDTAVGFHDASWQNFPFGSQKYKTSGSHGCVQLPIGVAAWLYAWAPVGTTVVVET